MKKKQHILLLDNQKWEQITELSEFYGNKTNSKTVQNLIAFTFDLMKNHQRTIHSLNHTDKLMMDQIKQLDNQTKINESTLMMLNAIVSWLVKTNKSFKDLSWDDIKNNKQKAIEEFKRSK